MSAVQLDPPLLEPRTDSPPSWDFVRRRFENCRSLHSACRRFVSVGYTPSRLLDVGDDLGESICLVGKEDVVGNEYATLSHCWGDGQIPRLAMDNENRFRKGVDTKDLPCTFADAVQVCRHLRIRYLWIDSLCIRQDSTEDWAIESSRMKNTYASAVVNIAASSAANSQDGLFFDRDPDLVSDRAFPADTYLCASHDKWTSVDELPLNRRGWVMQERLLSNRTLHFTSTEIFWQCRSQLSSESVSDLFSTGFYPEDEGTISGHMDLRGVLEEIQLHGAHASCLQRFAAAWSRVVRRYSGCGLSYDSDKLVALCGIVGEAEKVVGDECVAGHWKQQLPSSLCWMVFPQLPVPFSEKMPLPHRNQAAGERKRAQEWRAPTWSWASMNCSVSPYWEKGERIINVVQVLEASACRNINGSLTSAKLRVQGALFEAKCEVGKENESPHRDV
ncbi:heterokaryon incompatibility protein-domain-containing protein [Immersiella caudata]|uniref:Heterokaryon incompatibility protein-domain-containing protein n=1 Tax=Immersiella caudata TaxID=314043 RepID=A0AA39WJP0_9PEZI|nr:heterokaryon incompatibility protein-domain-containing protein [Immersiella caudata]